MSLLGKSAYSSHFGQIREDESFFMKKRAHFEEDMYSNSDLIESEENTNDEIIDLFSEDFLA